MSKRRLERWLYPVCSLLVALPLAAQGPADPKINEFVANHTGTDNSEYVEVFGDPGVDYSSFTVLEIEGDGSGAGVIDGVFPVGMTDAGGFYFTGFLSNELENGTLTLLLVEGFTGSAGDDLDTDDDGVLDTEPWSRVVDGVAVFDGGTSDATYTGTVLTAGYDGQPFTPGGASRIPDGADTDSTADWVRNDFDGDGLPGFTGTPEAGEAVNTPGAPNRLVDAGAAADPRINEFVANHSGTDINEYVEVFGDPGVDYSSFTVLEIEGDGSGAGVIDGVFPVGMTNAGGFYFTGFLSNELENGTLTLLLVEDFTGSAGDDLDSDNDGVLDTEPWSRVVDGVAVFDGGTSDATYTGTVLTAGYDGLPFTPGGASRIPDGADTDSTADWVRNDFDGAGLPAFPGVTAAPGEALNTPGASNRVAEALPTLVINEIDYDQPGTDTAEFVEIKNVSGGPLDLDPFALELVNGTGGGASVYSTIDLPAVTLADGGYFVVCANAATVAHCDLDVAPDTNLIQNGSPDAVALVRDGSIVDTVSYEGDTGAPYTEGSGAGLADDPGTPFLGISRFPDGVDTGQNNADLSPRCVTPGAPNTPLATGCTLVGPVLEIFEIQGNGLASPFEGARVTTDANVVTALAPDGFFIQTPEVRADADPETSNGLFVFTGGPPLVAVGDRVDVTGTVAEFFGFTELGSFPEVSVVASGEPLPDPVSFDTATPSPLQPQPATEYERYEGMRVEVAAGVVSGPNQRFGSDPVAEVFVVAGPERAFREPGIEFPGLPGLPVWDGNPEVFELDPDRLGLPNAAIPAGSTFSAAGVLGFEFGGYELWPTSYSFTPAELPRPVRERQPGEFTVGSLNLFRLFDDVDDPGIGETVVSSAEYARRLAKHSLYIRQVLGAPDILAVEEVEKLGVLQDLAERIAADDPTVVYTPYLEEGNDIGGIDVGLLVRDTVDVGSVTQLGADEIFSFDGSLLHDRPPLLLRASVPGPGLPFPIAVLVVHMRSLSGIDDPSDGPRVRQKRLDQAQSVARMVQDLQDSEPGIRLVVVGDFNAFQFTDGYVDLVGQIRGEVDPSENLLSGPDLVDPNLTDEVLSLPPEERYSFVFDGSAQVLDHALTSAGIVPLVRGFAYGRGDADAPLILLDDAASPLRASDHDGLVLYLVSDRDGDGVGDDVDDCPDTPDPEQADADGDGLADACLDACPGTAIPESVPTLVLGVNRWALVDGDLEFETTPPPGGGMGPGAAFTLEDTAGCSCEQIIDRLGLGEGHRMYGCSLGAMETWVSAVAK